MTVNVKNLNANKMRPLKLVKKYGFECFLFFKCFFPPQNRVLQKIHWHRSSDTRPVKSLSYLSDNFLKENILMRKVIRNFQTSSKRFKMDFYVLD